MAQDLLDKIFLLYLKKKQQLRNVINIDCLNYAGSFQNNLKIKDSKDFKFVKGSINNKKILKDIFNKYKISSIIHFAAQTHVDKSIKSSDAFFVNNVLGTLRLLEKSKDIDGKREILNLY